MSPAPSSSSPSQPAAPPRVEVIAPAAPPPALRPAPGATPQSAPRGARLRRLMAWVPGVPAFVALWLYLLDDETPLKHRLSIFFSLVYLVAPADFLPEMLLGPLGLVDDAAVLSGLIAFAASGALKAHKAKAKALLRGELDDQPD